MMSLKQSLARSTRNNTTSTYWMLADPNEGTSYLCQLTTQKVLYKTSPVFMMTAHTR